MDEVKDLLDSTSSAILQGALLKIASRVYDKVKKSIKNHRHHVVLKTKSQRYGEKLQKSQEILKNNDIGINDDENLVYLPQALHASLHTKLYVLGIYECLSPFSGSKENKTILELEIRRKAVIKQLDEIKLLLRRLAKLLVPAWEDPN